MVSRSDNRFALTVPSSSVCCGRSASVASACLPSAMAQVLRADRGRSTARADSVR